MENLTKQIEDLLSSNPDLQKTLDIFNETVKTYEESLRAMGFRPQYKTDLSSTPTQKLEKTTSSSYSTSIS